MKRFFLTAFCFGLLLSTAVITTGCDAAKETKKPADTSKPAAPADTAKPK